MYENLFTNISRHVTVTEELRRDLAAIVRVKRVKRREFVSQPGSVADCRNYVNAGALRSYFIDETGKEHTVQLSIEDWFISDFYSYITRTPGTLYIEAVERSELLQLPYDAVEPLCAKHLPLSEYFRKTTERAFAFSRIRVQADISKTAEERYLAFYERYPDIVHRMPQYAVAGYLGMSPEFLSKIRAKLAGA